MITELLAENVKKLTAIQINSDGKPIILTGENEAGKTTVLDCIWIALKGKIPAMPIRAGQEAARIKLTIWLDDEEREITVERTFTTKSSYISVRDESGKKMASPQKVLDSLISSLTLDPLEFSRMKAQDQRETLLRIAGIDLTQWEQDFKKAYEARTIAKRDAKTASTYCEGLPASPAGTPKAEVSASDMLDEIEGINGQRRVRAAALTKQTEYKQIIKTAEAAIERLETELNDAKELASNYNRMVIEQKIPTAPSDDDLLAKRTELTKIEATNTNVRTAIAKAAAKVIAQAKNKAAEASDKKVKAVEAEKVAMLEAADFGIPDLFVNDEGVIFEGKPLEQQSSARTIEISTRIAMRDKTKLKLLIIRDASLIGTTIFKRIAEMAEAEGYQMWVERFQEDPSEQGIHIVDGSVSHVDGVEVEQPAIEEEELETVEGL